MMHDLTASQSGLKTSFSEFTLIRRLELLHQRQPRKFTTIFRSDIIRLLMSSFCGAQYMLHPYP